MVINGNVKVHHILADGREVDSIEGHVVPDSGETAAVYRLIEDFIQNKSPKKSSDKGHAIA